MNGPNDMGAPDAYGRHPTMIATRPPCLFEVQARNSKRRDGNES